MNFNISVQREQLDHALKQTKKANKGSKPFAIKLSFDGNDLTLLTRHSAITLPATGCADVTVGLPGRVVTRLADTFPELDQIQLCLSGTSFKIGRLAIPCTVPSDTEL